MTHHTTMQRALMQHIHATEPTTRTQLEQHVNADTLDELLEYLHLNGHINYDRHTREYTLTENTRKLTEKQREHTRAIQRIYRHQTCDSCIQVTCVCNHRTECIGNGPHSLGCHGTHD